MKRAAAAVAAVLGVAGVVGVIWCVVSTMLYLGAYGNFTYDDWDL